MNTNTQQSIQQTNLFNPYNIGFNINENMAIQSLVRFNEYLMFQNSALYTRLIETNNALSLARVQNAVREATDVYALNRKVVAIALASTALNIAVGLGEVSIISLLSLGTVCLMKVISDKLELSEAVKAYAKKLQELGVFAPAILFGALLAYFLMNHDLIIRTSSADVFSCMFFLFVKELLTSMWIASALK